MVKEYSAKGLVYGKLWGGGFGSYESRELTAKTRAGIISQAKKEVKSGALDGGMGFEFLKGAVLNIKTQETITVKSKQYNRSVFGQVYIGNLTEKEKEFLSENVGFYQ